MAVGARAAAVFGLTLGLAMSLPAGASGADGKVRTLTVMATDYSLTAPAAVPAGLTRVMIMNHGNEGHQAALVRLESGRTRDEYLGALAQSLDAASEVGTFVAGPNGSAPGDTSEVTAELKPGHYLVLCLIPSPDGTPHVLKGMITELDATAAKQAAKKTSRAPVVRLREFEFRVPKKFVQAVSTGAPIDVVNDGKQAHEMVVSRLPDGVEIADIVNWYDHPLFTPEPYPPPQIDVGGTTMIAPGGRARLRLALPPGDYALLCFLPDGPIASGMSHLHQGMAYPFTVG
jgi:uncharacterized cupredoxin-like copper-binding protein